jgi:hypothetical protein
MRWLAEDGTQWASRFEYAVFKTLKDKGYNVFKTGIEDRMGYTDAVVNGECTQCGSSACVTRRNYTPDLLVGSPGASVEFARCTALSSRPARHQCYYIEAKGYLRADRRSLLRSFRKAWPALDFRLVVQRDYKVTKSLTITEWAVKFLKCQVHVWDGDLPEGWRPG